MSATCRSCGRPGLRPILSLGVQPLANSYPKAPNNNEGGGEARYPLDLVRCGDCSLVQITHVVPPEVLFRDYLYFSSYSSTMLGHAEKLADKMIEERRLGPQSLVAEVASNDGYLLQFYARRAVPVLGIEPAKNVAEVAERERGVRTVVEFFDEALGQRLGKERPADVLHAHNVLAHVADLNGFVAGLRHLLAPGGVVVSESPYLRTFIERNEFDTIYHEHLYYYSLTSLQRLFQRHGLQVMDCEQVPIHGGSLRIFVEHVGTTTPSARVRELLAAEAGWGVDRDEPYRRFAGRVEALRGAIAGAVRDLRREGKTVAAYGAAAKGTVLLNYTGLAHGDIDFVCDRSPHKQGRFMPGTGIPIVAPEELAARRPDYCLLLVWNIADEVMGQEAAYRRAGGRFIVPVPDVRVV